MEEVDAQALTTILMNIVQMYKPVWIVPLQRLHGWIIKPLITTDPIAQNLAQTTSLHKTFHGRSTETLPAHIAELQAERSLWWMAWTLGMLSSLELSPCQCQHRRGICRRHPRWNPRSKVVISRLITEWSRRRITNIGKDANVVFQTSTRRNAKTATGRASQGKVLDKGGGQEVNTQSGMRERDPRTST